MNLFKTALDTQTQALCATIAALPLDDQIAALNQVRQALHAISPFANEPVDCVLWKPAHEIVGNDYNPNRVAPPEMRLLTISILEDHYTQPIVTHPLSLIIRRKKEQGMTLPEIAAELGEPLAKIEAFDNLADGQDVVDGFHRYRVGRENRVISSRLHGYLPVSNIGSGRDGRNNRMASTIRHNRARGVHGVEPMANIVAELLLRGWNDDEIARELGMDADELLRFKQTTGLVGLFKDAPYSRAWE